MMAAIFRSSVQDHGPNCASLGVQSLADGVSDQSRGGLNPCSLQKIEAAEFNPLSPI